jgi:hypothetical protein
MNKKYLITSGCSFTEGQSWPTHLAKLMDRELVNKAEGGRGNYYISNQIYSTFADTKYNSANSKVVVMWSGLDRYDFYRKGEWLRPNARFYVKHHAIENSYLQSLQYIIGVQEFLNNRDIPYLFLTFMDIFDLDEQCLNLYANKQLRKLVDWDKFHFHKGTSGLDEWVKDNNLGILSDGHPDEESYKKYAEYLHNLKLI